jgi:hypothetical protein
MPTVSSDPPSEPGRRAILRNSGLGALALGGLAAGGALAGSTKPAYAAAVTDADILNFALNLEYLEAEFYLRATTGRGLPASDTTGSTGPSGGVTGGSKVPFASSAIAQYAMEITTDEVQHVMFLRAALGGQAVSEPAVNLVDSFNTLAQVAGLGSSFDPFLNDTNFLLGAYIFEDVGVTAYHGAAPLVQNKQVLAAAAGILGTEAYHAALVRTNLFERNQGPATAKISAVRAALSQAADDQGVVVNGVSNVVLNDQHAQVFSRTPRQVLNIVYGGVNATRGLFYPNGMNGAIR